MMYCMTANRDGLAKIVLRKFKEGYSRYGRARPIGNGYWVQVMTLKNEPPLKP